MPKRNTLEERFEWFQRFLDRLKRRPSDGAPHPRIPEDPTKSED